MGDGISFDKYIDNPSGTASYITNRNIYKSMYKSKFDKVLLREQGNIKYKVYHAKDSNDSYYIHMKIPSEVISNFYYDVVIRLFTTENKKKSSSKLREYAVQFYSNDPAFVYTFAYSFAKNKLFINDLSSKMSKHALKNAAKVRNPKNEVWYVKSLYFAYLAMEKYNLFSRAVLDHNCAKYDAKKLLNNIVHADTKVADRQREQENLQKELSKRKKSDRRDDKLQSKKTPISNITKTATTSRVIKSSKTTKSVKRTSIKKPSNSLK